MKTMWIWVIVVVCTVALRAQAQRPGRLDHKFKTDPGANDVVFDVDYASNGKIYIGGAFTHVDGIVKTRLARLHTDGALDTTFNCNIDGTVFDLIVLNDDSILISGGFNSAGGVAVDRLARILPSGQYDTTFALGSGFNGQVFDIAITPDNHIIAVGVFSTVSGMARPYIARIDMFGNLDTTFPVAEPNDYPYAVSVDPDGKIYVSGSFTTIGGVSRPGLARLQADGALDTTFTPYGINVAPDVVTPSQSGVYIGGYFTTVNSTPINRLARLDASGNLDNSFVTGTGPDGGVLDIAVQNDGKIIIVGNFTSYDGSGPARCARINLSGARDTNFFNFFGDAGSGVDTVRIQPGGGILLGGHMTNFGFLATHGYCRLMGDHPVMNDFDGDGYTDIAVYYGNVGDWYIQASSDGELMDGAAINWGWGGAVPVTADFDMDGKTDLCVYDRNTGDWYIRPSVNPQVIVATNFGWSGAIPVVGDYNGDRIPDLAVYDRNAGNWYIKDILQDTVEIINWGWAGAMPVPADYDGDGTMDIAVYYPTTGTWYIRSSGGFIDVRNWGWAAAQPVPWDYDLDGKADIAVYHAAAGKWYISYYTGQSQEYDWGGPNSLPVCGLYNASTFENITTYAPLDGVWSVWPAYTTATWGWPSAWPVWLQFWINDYYGFWSQG
ncbi:MAG: hypothetical protein EOM20_02855 [Spartobacteria bacterium]|nr:hypothetical protein [Spartobacteria bacterium]